MSSRSAKEAARDLYQRYGNEVYRYLRYCVGSAADADDLVQEVFLRVIQSWDRFAHKSTEKTWLWAITNNCVRDHLRKRQRDTRVTSLRDRDEQTAAKTDTDLFLQLEQSLSQLPLYQRQVFVERVIHQYSTAETAEVLGWSEAKVRTTLHRAMKQIRRYFEEGTKNDERTR